MVWVVEAVEVVGDGSDVVVLSQTGTGNDGVFRFLLRHSVWTGRDGA